MPHGESAGQPMGSHDQIKCLANLAQRWMGSRKRFNAVAEGNDLAWRVIAPLYLYLEVEPLIPYLLFNVTAVLVDLLLFVDKA